MAVIVPGGLSNVGEIDPYRRCEGGWNFRTAHCRTVPGIASLAYSLFLTARCPVDSGGPHSVPPLGYPSADGPWGKSFEIKLK